MARSSFMQAQAFCSEKILIGRCEWCSLPQLGISAIKAKIDTGAKTSAIHAFDIKPMVIDKKDYVSFNIHPMQGDSKIVIACQAPIIDARYIMSSNGHKEHRYIIKTEFKLGGGVYDMELSLSNRDPLKFRLLLGREALSKRVIIDPGLTCLHGRFKKSQGMIRKG